MGLTVGPLRSEANAGTKRCSTALAIHKRRPLVLGYDRQVCSQIAARWLRILEMNGLPWTSDMRMLAADESRILLLHAQQADRSSRRLPRSWRVAVHLEHRES
jgi:hypothetical protein